MALGGGVGEDGEEDEASPAPKLFKIRLITFYYDTSIK